MHANQRDRKTFIGGSDVAAILGYSKWKTPIDIFLEKTTDYERSNNPRRDFKLKVGKALEDIILDDYQDEFDVKLERNVEIESDTHDYLMGHADAVVLYHNDGTILPEYLLEVKTVYSKNDEWGEPGTDQIPIDYLYQCAYYCWLKKCYGCIIIAHFKDTDEKEIYKYTRVESLEAEMETYLPRFWEECVLKNEFPPAIRVSDVPHFYKNIETIKLDVDKHQTITAIESYKVLNERIKILEKEKEKLRDNIATALGGYGNIMDWEGKQIGSFKNQKSERVDMDKLKTSYSQIYEDCLKTSYSQVLRIK